LKTVEEYTRAFDHAARWGWRNKRSDKRKMQYPIYYETKAEVPLLGAGLVQSSKNVACQALKRCNFRAVPNRRRYAAVRYTWKEAKVYFNSGMEASTLTRERYMLR